jgi:hypothetical protein
MNEETQPGRLGIADVLQELGAELREAAERGGSTISWMSAEVELEVAVEITAGGGVKFWVLNAEAAAAKTRTTRIKVNLTPHSDFEQPLGMGM